MSVFNPIIGGDVVLDEAAFDKAIADYAALSDKLKKLRSDIEDMMSVLKAGFDTPAGVKFINACEANIFKPLDDQKLVLDHISTTLSEAKQSYSSVFSEYENLQTAIRQVNIN